MWRWAVESDEPDVPSATIMSIISDIERIYQVFDKDGDGVTLGELVLPCWARPAASRGRTLYRDGVGRSAVGTGEL